ncbi:hypothetical protein KKB64_02510 [Patescibacteria group bacterium]|nr:hypothetical protein [Patescibacteria group bacterium]MBU2460150.1 hypothetical protein [Patescibacteria group bacterium]MBU2544425.1 hypothetical protein [Patescibacteria group bacterium]
MEYIKAFPYDVEAACIHEQTPEFSLIPPKDILHVNVGSIAIGSIEDRFRSKGFYLCSGIAIKDPFEQKFGFFHVYPGHELTDDDIKTLTPLADGSACLIRGSNSTEKRRLLRELSERLSIIHTDTIAVDTCSTNDKSLCFHVAYRPAANQMLVARISHKDVLTYVAFKS